MLPACLPAAAWAWSPVSIVATVASVPTMTAGPVLLPAPLADKQYLAAAFFLFYLKQKGSLPGGVRLRWTVSE